MCSCLKNNKMNNKNSGLKVFVSDEIFNFRTLDEKQSTKSPLSRAYSNNAIIISNKEVYGPKDRRTLRPEKKLIPLYGNSHCSLSNTKYSKPKSGFKGSRTPVSNILSISRSASELINPKFVYNCSRINHTNSEMSHLIKTNKKIEKPTVDSLNLLSPRTVNMPKTETYQSVEKNGRGDLNNWTAVKEALNSADRKNKKISDDNIENDEANLNDGKFCEDLLNLKENSSIISLKSSFTIPLLSQPKLPQTNLRLWTKNNQKCTAYEYDDGTTAYKYDDGTTVCNMPLPFQNSNKKSQLMMVFLELLGSVCGILVVSLMAWYVTTNYHRILQLSAPKFAKPKESVGVVRYLELIGATIKYSWQKLYSSVYRVLVLPVGFHILNVNRL